MLNLKNKIEVQYVSGGLKAIAVRWPTDAEWCARNRKIRIVHKDLGRSRSQTDTFGVDEANAELVAAIRLDQGEPIDPVDATEIIRRLESARVITSEVVGERATVTLRAMGQNLEHVLRAPSGRDKKEFYSASLKRYGIKAGTETRQSLEPAGEVYDRLKISANGYDCDVPILHKEAVLFSIFATIDEMVAAEDEDPEE